MRKTVCKAALALAFSAAVGMFGAAEDASACEASFYGYELAGSPTATGEPFDPEGITAAHPYLPLGSYALVTNLYSGAAVVVRINDRGPAAWTGRCIDLSQASAFSVGIYGVGYVSVEPL